MRSPVIPSRAACPLVMKPNPHYQECCQQQNDPSPRLGRGASWCHLDLSRSNDFAKHRYYRPHSCSLTGAPLDSRGGFQFNRLSPRSARRLSGSPTELTLLCQRRWRDYMHEKDHVKRLFHLRTIIRCQCKIDCLLQRHRATFGPGGIESRCIKQTLCLRHIMLIKCRVSRRKLKMRRLA